MADFLGAMVFVFGGVLAIALLVAAIFAMLATPKKGQPIEDNHKAAKKKANICALVAGGCLVLGVVCAILNSVIIQNERKDSIDSQLFGDKQSSAKSYPELLSSRFKGKTREDFEQYSEMYNFYQGDECIVSKNNELNGDTFYTSSYDPKNMTLAGLYEYEPNTKSSEIAYQILKTFSDTVDKAESNTAYQHIYLDWALWGGKPVAYWTLSKGADGKFYQDSDIVWYNPYVKEAFTKLTDR